MVLARNLQKDNSDRGHRVPFREKGDTSPAVAHKTMGNASANYAISEANKPMLTHPDRIYPDQVLRIPTQA